MLSLYPSKRRKTSPKLSQKLHLHLSTVGVSVLALPLEIRIIRYRGTVTGIIIKIQMEPVTDMCITEQWVTVIMYYFQQDTGIIIIRYRKLTQVLLTSYWITALRFLITKHRINIIRD